MGCRESDGEDETYSCTAVGDLMHFTSTPYRGNTDCTSFIIVNKNIDYGHAISMGA